MKRKENNLLSKIKRKLSGGGGASVAVAGGENPSGEKTLNLAVIKKDAEDLYRNGDFYCSEAIVYVIRKHIDPAMPAEAVSMSSGFPVGVGGSLCICGAISGGIMCFGYFFGRSQPKDKKSVNKTMALSKELYDYFVLNHKFVCCKILTKGMKMGSAEHMKQCVSFTGEIAEKTAEIIGRELGLRFTANQAES